jgi:hypothetical protein
MKIKLLKEMVGKVLGEELQPAHKFEQGFDDVNSAKNVEAKIKKLNPDLTTKIKKSGSSKRKPIILVVTIPDDILTSSLSNKVNITLTMNESNLREVSDFKIDGSSLKQYQSTYPNFKFSIDSDSYGNKQLVADVPKRKQEIKFYVWNGKINAQVTNGGLSNHATLDAALDHLYRQYGTTAPSSKQSDKIAKFNNKK